MSNIKAIEPMDDGLLMGRPGGDWTYDKLYFVNEYFKRFIVSMRKKRQYVKCCVNSHSVWYPEQELRSF